MPGKRGASLLTKREDEKRFTAKDMTIDYDAYGTAREEAHHFTREASVNQSLQELTLEELYGYIPFASTFDTHANAVCAVHRYRDDDLEKLQPNFAFRPLEVIRKTLEFFF